MHVDNLIDLSSGGSMTTRVNEVKLEIFWSQCGAECKLCHDAPVNDLLPFPTSSLCDAGLSAMTARIVGAHRGLKWTPRPIFGSPVIL